MLLIMAKLIMPMKIINRKPEANLTEFLLNTDIELILA